MTERAELLDRARTGCRPTGSQPNRNSNDLFFLSCVEYMVADAHGCDGANDKRNDSTDNNRMHVCLKKSSVVNCFGALSK